MIDVKLVDGETARKPYADMYDYWLDLMIQLRYTVVALNRHNDEHNLTITNPL
jgi:hypothetical protein